MFYICNGVFINEFISHTRTSEKQGHILYAFLTLRDACSFTHRHLLK